MTFLRSWNATTALTDDPQHARENYRPSRVVPTAEMAFAHWTERAAAQPALVTAREMAGLSNENLSALALEFEQSPQRKRRDVYRFAVPAGASATFLGVVLMTLHKLAEAPFLLGLGGVVAILGFVALCVGVLVNFQRVPLEVAYGKVGLFVGELNEQHPWLYKTMLLMNNTAANAYRERVLQERGALRGVDYVMMEEIASVHESMELTQTARVVRDRVQGSAVVR